MKFVIKWTLPVLLLFSMPLSSQTHDQEPVLVTLKELFEEGKVEGHIRNYFMSTINQGDLRDYYTNAIGGALLYRTKPYKGIELGVKGIFTYKGFSSDLNQADELVGEVSKWEHELYDINDLNNFNDLDRLEELFLKYHFDKGSLTYGKLEIEDTPLLNESDGRMKPFAFKGFWLQLHHHQHQLAVSWLDRVSPRSTVEWYDFNEAIGLTNNGFQPNGQEADYRDHTESRGIALLQYELAWDELRFRANHWYLHHLFNTTMLQMEYRKNAWSWGLQYAIQNPDPFMEELPYERRYMQPDERGQVLSGVVRYSPSRWNFEVAFTRVLDQGRFLFPRELGRDRFFTSVSRSRLEGVGDAEVLTLIGEHQLDKRFHVRAEYTRLFGPQLGNFTNNKYNLDEYDQYSTRLHYEFEGFFRGLNLSLLYVYKKNRNSNDPFTVFNRSNYHQLNFVTNYNF